MSAALTRIDTFLSQLAERSILAPLFVAVFAVLLFLPGFASLPPTDRDEARFAQASRQMAETGDLIDIRLGASTRYKKPVGIYWLQTASVWITGATNEIWAYRLPSLLSAVGSAVLTYLVALSLMGARPAFLAGLLMASTLTLGAEARIAKTDAALLLTTLLAIWPLAKLHMTGQLQKPWIFWAALGASMLIKGPIAIMVVGLAIAALSLVRRDITWLAPLKPNRGLVLFAAIVLPWYVAISFTAGWAFWDEALIGDFLSKIGEGQESHGAPPGTYLLAVWLTFWPAAVMLPMALWFGWTHRRDQAVLFCLAWIIPTWIVFEITATKLLHYVLPVYPALAILAAAGWLARSEAPGRAYCWAAAAILGIGLITVMLPLGFVLWLGGVPHPIWLLGFVLFALGAFVFWCAFRAGLPLAPGLLAGILTAGVMTSFFATLARFDALWPSNALAAFVAEAPCLAPQIFSARYHEASLIFLSPSWPVFTSAPEAASGAVEAGCAVVFVDARDRQAFDAALGAVTAQEIGSFYGFTLGRAEEVEITAWVIDVSPGG
ncbi:MAG: glycosyltransferase family 39 protein [Pseudomonadota bacterium]